MSNLKEFYKGMKCDDYLSSEEKVEASADSLAVEVQLNCTPCTHSIINRFLFPLFGVLQAAKQDEGNFLSCSLSRSYIRMSPRAEEFFYLAPPYATRLFWVKFLINLPRKAKILKFFSIHFFHFLVFFTIHYWFH